MNQTHPPASLIHSVADKLNIPAYAREMRLADVLKIDPDVLGPLPEKGRVVLVTAMTPTPAGEGKTTTSIGLVDALCKRGVNAAGALREPSLGPVFGRKGGAVGGGLARILPDDAINLHFTGDIHAVTSAHNLLAAMADNHDHFNFDPKLDAKARTFGRVMDMNDRALRTVDVGFASGAAKVRRTRFDITAASEVMAILCLSRDIADARKRLGNIAVGLSEAGDPVTADMLGCGGAMAALLLDAMRPNLVRTLEGNPVFLHGGPFANVAQGTSSLRQTRLARQLADVVVTEGGFAFDLGGFKFLDIKCRNGGFLPAAVVLVVTVRAVRCHGKSADYNKPDATAVTNGLENIGAHIDAMTRLGLPKPIIAINRFPDDTAEELQQIKDYVSAHGGIAVEASHFAKGGDGAVDLADIVMQQLASDAQDSPNYQSPYNLADSISVKLQKVARTVLGATDAQLTETAQAQLSLVEKMGLSQAPICLAKTHLSISDDAKVQGRPPPFTLSITGLRPLAGAGFVVALCGPILTMPGLPEVPQAAHIDVELRDPANPALGWRIVGVR